MRWCFTAVLWVLLTSCNTFPHGSVQLESSLGTAEAYQVAWGERIRLETGTVGVRVTYLGKTTTFNSSNAIFNIPRPSGAPDLTFSDPVSPTAYTTVLDAGTYVERGSVEVLGSGGTVLKKYQPYGAVEPGQLVALANVQDDCDSFYAFISGTPSLAQFELLNTRSTALSGNSWLCYTTLDIHMQGTEQALDILSSELASYPNYRTDNIHSGFVVDKNHDDSLDPPAKSFDPSCDQILKYLDPIGDNGYLLLHDSDLLTDTGAQQAGVTGAGVRVIIVGGGVGPNDLFACGNVFFDHDSHIFRIIEALAPGATISAVKVCGAEGNCPASRITQALMTIMSVARQNPEQAVIVNLSLGGPLPNRPMFEALKVLGERYGVTVFASGGNGPNAPEHFPAGHDAQVASDPSLALDNVISVAALGKKNSGYKIAGFNTRANASLFAPGVNICVSTVENFRCDPSASAPDDQGATGSSFAAPGATGLAALYLSLPGFQVADLRTCLADSAAANPAFAGMIWFDSTVASCS